MAVQSGGGSGADAGYIPLLDFLRAKLGGFYFDSEGMPVKDKAYVNLIRLRALFERTGENSLLVEADRGEDDNQVTIHELVQRTEDDRTLAATNALFGQPGRININLGGNDMPTGGNAADAVAFQWSQMESLGELEEVRRQEPIIARSDDGRDAPTLADLLGIGDPGAGDRDPRPSGGADIVSGAGDGDPRPAGGSGSSGGGWSGQADSSLPAEGTARQVPGGEELWHVDGKVYLAYENERNPGLWMIWHVESPERLEAIYGGNTPAFDREMSEAQLKQMSPWMGGLSAELQNTSENPWQQFNSDFQEAAKLRPWLNDPTVQAVMQGAYLEGRAPTQDELSQTDWWNDHTAAERQWLEQSVTMGREELARQRDDAARSVGQALRQAGVSNAPDELVKYIAEQTLTGKWSEAYAQEQIRKLSDPFAPGSLDKGISELLDGVDLDTTRKHEDQVRGLMEEWLGPDLGKFSDKDVARWAGRVRNDPDAAVELEEMLREQRQIILPGYNPNRTYREIITPVENLGTQIWGRPIEDSAFLIDLANTQDYSEMGKRLRSEGRKRGVQKVVNDALAGLGQTAIGEQVVRSTV